jgi:DnaJ-class molecular chaperone
MHVKADPFFDEIAIDFPSAGRFVDRVREAFVSEGAPRANDALQADVRITPWEARHGAVLPVDLALKVTCHVCGGRGESWAERCVACEGSGDEEIPYLLRVTVPAGVAHGAKLRMRVRTPSGTSPRVEVNVVIGERALPR